MQTICVFLQTDNHTNTPSLIFAGRMLFPMLKALNATIVHQSKIFYVDIHVKQRSIKPVGRGVRWVQYAPPK